MDSTQGVLDGVPRGPVGPPGPPELTALPATAGSRRGPPSGLSCVFRSTPILSKMTSEREAQQCRQQSRRRIHTSAPTSIALNTAILTAKDLVAAAGVFPAADVHEPLRRVRPARVAQIPSNRGAAAAAQRARGGHGLMRWGGLGGSRAVLSAC